jgi:hypothetical protein
MLETLHRKNANENVDTLQLLSYTALFLPAAQTSGL